MRFDPRCLAFIVLAIIIHASESLAIDQPRFRICASNLSDAVPGYAEGLSRPHLVNILLNDSGAEQLKRFTAGHIGLTAEVSVGDTVLSIVPVHVVVDSGRMQLSYEAESEAKAVLAKVKAAPASPCGAQ